LIFRLERRRSLPKDIGIIQLRKTTDLIVGDTVPTIRQNRFLTLRQMGVSSRVVTGIHKLAQFITKLLLTTQGSDKYDINYGSSLNYLLRSSRSLSELRDIQGQVAVHMRDVRTQVIRSQAGLNLPRDERLRDLTLLRAVFLEDELKFEIDLRVVSEAGNERVLNLEQVLEEGQEV
jgi:hypothetical protein